MRLVVDPGTAGYNKYLGYMEKHTDDCSDLFFIKIEKNYSEVLEEDSFEEQEEEYYSRVGEEYGFVFSAAGEDEFSEDEEEVLIRGDEISNEVDFGDGSCWRTIETCEDESEEGGSFFEERLIREDEREDQVDDFDVDSPPGSLVRADEMTALWESDAEKDNEEFFNTRDRTLVHRAATDETGCLLDINDVN